MLVDVAAGDLLHALDQGAVDRMRCWYLHRPELLRRLDNLGIVARPMVVVLTPGPIGRSDPCRFAREILLDCRRCAELIEPAEALLAVREANLLAGGAIFQCENVAELGARQIAVTARAAKWLRLLSHCSVGSSSSPQI